MSKSANLIEIKHLTKTFHSRRGFKKHTVCAVNDVSLDIRRGETLGVIGESGCGKSTLGRCLLQLVKPDSGSITYGGETIFDGSGSDRDLSAYRRKMQMIFQNPAASLDPLMSVQEAIGEAVDIHRICTGADQRRAYILSLLNQVGLSEQYMNRLPRALSGGQQQRVGIARALAVNPEFVVCDEPLSALDASIQSQIINMLQDLQQERGLTYLFISHDISVVKHISDRIAIMYLGKIVELCSSEQIIASPLHPYTMLLLSSIPNSEFSRIFQFAYRETEIDPAFVGTHTGCSFADRCPLAAGPCFCQIPALRQLTPGHHVACHLADQFM